MESFALHPLSTTATSASFSHHPSRLSILRRISPPSTISLPYLRYHSVQPLTFPLRFSKRIAATPKDDTPVVKKKKKVVKKKKKDDTPSPTESPSPQPPQGAKLVPLIRSVGFILRFAVSVPEGVTPQGWQLISICLYTAYLIESHLQEEDKLIKEAIKIFDEGTRSDLANWFMEKDKNSPTDLMAMTEEDFVEAVFKRFRFHR